MKTGERSICPFCSMGCSLLIHPGTGAPYVGQEGIPALDYDEGGRVNHGSLCGKGNMALELLMHPKRLDAPQLRREGELVEVTWDEALGDLVARLEAIRETEGSASIGLLAGPYLTNEETGLVLELAKKIGTPHVDFSQPEDRAVLAGLRRSRAHPTPVSEVEEIEAMTAVLAVGDVFTLAPCLSKPVLAARYDRRRNLLGVLGFWKSRTALFAKPMLTCRPGQEAAALALLLRMALEDTAGRSLGWRASAHQVLDGMDGAWLEEVAGLDLDSARWLLDALRKEEHSGVLVGCGFAETERPDLVTGLAALLAEATGSRFLTMLAGPNSRGVQETLREGGYPAHGGLTAPEMAEASGTGDLAAILAFGCDPLGSVPGRIADEATGRLALLTMTAPLPGETAHAADVVLATAAWGEKGGTVVNSFGHANVLSDIMPPPGSAKTDAEVLEMLRDRLADAPASSEAPLPDRRGRQEDFFGELELHLRLERRGLGTREIGRYKLFPEYLPAHAGDGWLTRHLSWPNHEMPEPTLAISPVRAAELGVVEGDRVEVRSRDAVSRLRVRFELNLPEDVVLAPPHFPEIRRLTSWRLDPTLRDLDVRPGRVSVDALEEDDA